MAKKSAPKTKKPVKKKSKRLLPAREHVIMILLAVIGLFALCYFAFNQCQVSQEKKAFADAEAVLTQLSKDIEAKLGPPTSSEVVRQCAYASAKYVKGGPRCSVSIELKYPNNGLEDMKQKQFTILTLLKTTQGLDLTSDNYSTFENQWPTESYKESSADFKITRSSLYCSETVSSKADDQNLRIAVGCYKDTKKEYFPVKE